MIQRAGKKGCNMITITLTLERVWEGAGLPTEKWKVGVADTGATGSEKAWFAERTALLKFDGLLKGIESEFVKYAFAANAELKARQTQKGVRSDPTSLGPLV
jgi:hypothetical protein